MAFEMASVLRRLKLDHLIDKFISEKITPDLVGKLSLNDFRELGVHNRNKIMKLRQNVPSMGRINRPEMCEMDVVLPCSKYHDLFWSVTLNKFCLKLVWG